MKNGRRKPVTRKPRPCILAGPLGEGKEVDGGTREGERGREREGESGRGEGGRERVGVIDGGR